MEVVNVAAAQQGALALTTDSHTFLDNRPEVRPKILWLGHGIRASRVSWRTGHIASVRNHGKLGYCSEEQNIVIMGYRVLQET